MDADLVIRNGTIVDGTGAPAYVGTVAIKDGLIAALGPDVVAKGRREIDATGRLVTPGWCDIHTHYDGQVSWDPTLAPSSGAGVTTAIMGNCGVGFAPIQPSRRAMLIELMEAVEDIPGTALYEGIDWQWTTFPEYLDFVGSRPKAINVAVMIGHGPVRTYCMGERASLSDRPGGPVDNPVTDEEIKDMAKVVGEAVEAGAIGFSTSRLLLHRDKHGILTPGCLAAEKELLAISKGMAEAGGGVFEMSVDFSTYDDILVNKQNVGLMLAHMENTWSWMKKISNTKTGFGIPVSYSFAAGGNSKGYRDGLRRMQRAKEEGCNITGQTFIRPQGMLFGWFTRTHPFSECTTFRTLRARHAAKEDLAQVLQLPETKKAILSEAVAEAGAGKFSKKIRPMLGGPDSIYRWHESYEPAHMKTVNVEARERGMDALELVYDAMCQDGCNGTLWRPLFGADGDGTLNGAREILTSEHTVPGIGDAGAHVSMMTDGASATHLLRYWVCDRQVGEQIPLELAVKKVTYDGARLFGIEDRGTLETGMRADVNVINMDELRLHCPQHLHDLPTGAPRWSQCVSGYDFTICNGMVIWEGGVPTGALPGELIRNPRVARARAAGHQPTLPDLQPDEYLPLQAMIAERAANNGTSKDASSAVENLAQTAVLGPSAMGQLERNLRSVISKL